MKFNQKELGKLKKEDLIKLTLVLTKHKERLLGKWIDQSNQTLSMQCKGFSQSWTFAGVYGSLGIIFGLATGYKLQSGLDWITIISSGIWIVLFGMIIWSIFYWKRESKKNPISSPIKLEEE